VNPIVDNIIVGAFVLFMVFIFRGYHLSKMRERGELNEKDEKDTTE